MYWSGYFFLKPLYQAFLLGWVGWWLGGRKGIRPVKNWVVGCWRGYLSGDRGAGLHIAHLMPLPLTVSCFSEIQIGFTSLVPAHPGSPRQRAVRRMWVWVGILCWLWPWLVPVVSICWVHPTARRWFEDCLIVLLLLLLILQLLLLSLVILLWALYMLTATHNEFRIKNCKNHLPTIMLS